MTLWTNRCPRPLVQDKLRVAKEAHQAKVSKAVTRGASSVVDSYQVQVSCRICHVAAALVQCEGVFHDNFFFPTRSTTRIQLDDAHQVTIGRDLWEAALTYVQMQTSELVLKVKQKDFTPSYIFIGGGAQIPYLIENM